jgi:broad specificity phosphatase PhoE
VNARPQEVAVALIRHPETVANVEGRFVGRGESPMTDLGGAQVVSIAMMMESWKPGAVISSPRERALTVAQRISACGTPLRVLDELAEIDFGRAEGLTWAELRALGIEVCYPSTVLRAQRADDALGGPVGGPVALGGEAWGAFMDRVRTAARVIESAAPRVAVVTHGGVIRALLTHWLGLDDAAAWRFAVPGATIATLTLRDGVGVLESLLPPAS